MESAIESVKYHLHGAIHAGIVSKCRKCKLGVFGRMESA